MSIEEAKAIIEKYQFICIGKLTDTEIRLYRLAQSTLMQDG